MYSKLNKRRNKLCAILFLNYFFRSNTDANFYLIFFALNLISFFYIGHKMQLQMQFFFLFLVFFFLSSCLGHYDVCGT